MKTIIVAVICLSLGAVFGAFIMCLMQIKRNSDYDASSILEERDINERIEWTWSLYYTV